MGRNLHTAKRYEVQYSPVIIAGGDSEECMTHIFHRFAINAGDNEYCEEYEIERTELIRLRDMIINRTELFVANEEALNEELKVMRITLDEFIKALNELITTSDQNNEYVLLSWY